MPKVTIALGTGPMSAQVFMAEHKGYFQEEGVQVELVRRKSGPQALIAMLEGKADIAHTSSVSIVLENLDFSKYAIIATGATADDLLKVVGRKDRGILTPKDLRGKTIGVIKGTYAHFYVYKVLSYAGIPFDEVRIVFMKKPQLAPALADGSIDAFCQHSQPITQAQKLLGDNFVMLKSGAMGRQIVSHIASRDTIKAKREGIKRMYAAMIRANEYILTHPQETIKVVAEAQNIKLGKVKRFIEKEGNYEIGLKQALLTTLEGIDQWAMQCDLVQYDTPRNFLGLIDYSILEEVDPDSVTLIH
ncbi:ABC transporter substrate-binding protein [Pseudodesulfovibrio tunisiensis]|uniref:ABC transporter substrate-binding protein n=1 Tax=Pseudodesulfovibrio tunisiensis TaxID=463192 RepID=UPI0024363332|nr:NrtA/SsuA/CpmA family ABC transporter substrate-binding protein [Pseudodesulfovibrio tunisiensis]